jgi:PadR family transcriptional regulator, regulatory protein PadR
MRRKTGALVPFEESILVAAIQLWNADEQEFYGYQIAKHLADASDRKLLTAYGTLYRALGRLEAMGLLRSAWEDPRRAAEESRPGRRLYVLTDAGLERAQAQPTPARASRSTSTARRRRRRLASA